MFTMHTHLLNGHFDMAEANCILPYGCKTCTCTLYVHFVAVVAYQTVGIIEQFSLFMF